MNQDCADRSDLGSLDNAQDSIPKGSGTHTAPMNPGASA